MELTGGHVRVKDVGANKNATLVYMFPPTWQQGMTAIVGGAIAGSYQAAPSLAQCFALIAWDDNTLHISTLDNLQLLR